jgi:MFS family permease
VNKLCIILMVFMFSVDTTMLSTIIPQIVASLGQMQLYPFMSAGFLLAFVLATPVFGTVCDRVGGRRAGLTAVAIFLGGSFLCGRALSMQELIIARLIQGIGAGGMVNTSYFIVGKIYSQDSSRSRMQAILSIVWACGSIFGPLIAAFITTEFGWRWVFFINLPIGLLVSYFLRLLPSESAKNTHEPFDFWGLFLFASGSLLIFFGLQVLFAEDRIWLKSSLLTAGIILNSCFLVHAFLVRAPLIPFKLLGTSSIGICVLFGFFSGICITTASSMISLYTQGVLRESLRTTGYVITIMSLAWAAGSITCGLLINSLGLRKVIAVGMVLLLVGFSKLAFFSTHDSIYSFLIAISAIGVGLGIMLNSTIVGVQGAAEKHFLGRTTALLSLIRTGGSALGSAISGMLQVFSFRYYLQAGSQRELSSAISTLLIARPEKFLEPDFLKKISVSEGDVLRQYLAYSIENVFFVPIFLLILLLPFCYFLPFATNTAPKEK